MEILNNNINGRGTNTIKHGVHYHVIFYFSIMQYHHNNHHHYPIPPLGEWDFVVVWFRVHYYYYSLPCSKQWLISHKVFKLSQ